MLSECMNIDIGFCHVENKNIDIPFRGRSHRSLPVHLNLFVMCPERLHHTTDEEVEMNSQTLMASIIDSEKVSIFLLWKTPLTD